MPLCTTLANDHWGMSSSELGAPVSHFGQESAIAQLWSLGRELGILLFHSLSSLLFLHWQSRSSVEGGEEIEHL